MNQLATKPDNAETAHALMRDDRRAEGRALRQAEAVSVLKANLAALMADDPELMADTIEGETSFYEALDAIVTAMDEDAILIDGIKAREAELSERRRRMEKRVETRRALAEQMLVVADERKVERSTYTMSLAARPAKLTVTDEAAIPSTFFKTKPVLDRSGLTKALKDGEQVPGASLDNGGQSLTLRRK